VSYRKNAACLFAAIEPSILSKC